MRSSDSLRMLDAHSITALALSPDGLWLCASASDDMGIYIWK